MLKSHEKFHSANGKRRILIAEDELINREILGEMLQPDYELLFACDGAETMEMIRRYRNTLSLVLLDILMPVMSGLEVLKAVKEDGSLSRIPIIVTTAERETEIESLMLGAIDFIPKPYPAVGVIQARVRRTIELSEDRDIIQSTERDELTGLYNKEFFYRYAEQFDQHHPELQMDAILVDINHFHMINERYGRAYGDEVLRKVGEQVRNIVRESGGIVCRKEADTFLIYCPHREDYPEIMEKASIQLADDDSSGGRVRLRMGVYSNADKSIDIERRMDRAKMAADSLGSSVMQNIGFYDDSLHEQQLYAEQLIEDFSAAIAEKQFQVFYQPKFDIRPDTPILASAEALVRWLHPTLGMISPGVFVPLFEDNGLIQQLDTYVWRETARQVREWKDRLDCAVPVSVNVSRVDLYDQKLPEKLLSLLREFGLSGGDMLLEVTESAYTKDSKQIIEMVEKLRKIGFRIEMDDFGTGYSSLNMISNLPVDALKLDMQFIRNAFRQGGNTHMVEVIIGISDYLSVPVIAEGVETEEQLHALRKLGCDLVQGYFFSKPVPASEFEAFILQKKEAELAYETRLSQGALGTEEAEVEEAVRQAKINVLREATEHNQLEEENERAGESDTSAQASRSGIQLRTLSIFFVILALLAAAALLIVDVSVTRGYQRMEQASDRYIAAQLAASDLETGSDYLTDRARCFVVTGELEYLDDFFEEVEVTRRRDNALQQMEQLFEGKESSATRSLHTALELSNELIVRENLAMRLIAEACGYEISRLPAPVASVRMDEYRNLSAEELKQKAQELIFDREYMSQKERIRENVSLCTHELVLSSSHELENASARLSLLVNVQTFMTLLFLMIVLGIVMIVTLLIRRPLSNMMQKMQVQETIRPTGVEELRFVTRTYNKILRENREAREKLSHEASHDALTGLFNRGAYDMLMESADTRHMALLLIDVDHFKAVNDTYGHAVGDRVLKRVADTLRASFRSVDILCRLGGDEFAVVMTRVNSSMRSLVVNKIEHVNDLLQHPTDDLPPVSLSVGIAFSDRENPQGDIFRDADTALYRVKAAGRNGCAVYE